MSDLEAALVHYQNRIEQVLEDILPDEQQLPSKLHQAMRYCVLNGGKRIRPMLVYATGVALGLDEKILDNPAAAIELLHVYSLVHDDLPAMDDDDLRRGKLTCHRAYDEATAILVGDALQALSFQTLSRDVTGLNAQQRLNMLQTLAHAAGSLGMVGGQVIDLTSVGQPLSESELETMHQYKTGALIQASVLMPAHGTRCSTAQWQALQCYAKNIGLAFQVQDDILDIESSTQVLGKTQGADIAANKPTYPSIIGMSAAKEKLHYLHQTALEALKDWDERASLLRKIAEFTVKRLH